MTGEMIFKLGPNQEAWLHDLETTDAPQGTGRLCQDGHYCCLGRGCEVLGVPRHGLGDGLVVYGEVAKRISATAPPELIDKLGLRSEFGDGLGDFQALTTMNDHGITFKGIAVIVRANPAAYFKESK